MYPGVEHFNTSEKWKFNDSSCIENDNVQNLEHNLDRIRSLSHERNFIQYGGKDQLLEVEVNNVVEDDSDESKDCTSVGCREGFDEKGEHVSVPKFSRHSSLSNRELDVIKESSRSSSDTEVTLTR
ncbi:hypothetical protein RR48_11795 [Papilio machaon]|uniref:Uncharacterized protein n=1 Tax=Papilio machaon TaxID=76193 RepID=A0A194QMH7_PAPMA|nr:hypothetical protein RR48_11795 [Papilio machaon]